MVPVASSFGVFSMEVHSCFHCQRSPQRPAQRQAEAVGELRSAGTSATRGGGRPRRSPGRLGPEAAARSGHWQPQRTAARRIRRSHCHWPAFRRASGKPIPPGPNLNRHCRRHGLAPVGSPRVQARESAPPSSCRHSSLAVTLGRQLWHIVALSRQSLRVIEPSVKSRLARLGGCTGNVWHCSARARLSEHWHWHCNTKTVTPVTADAAAASAGAMPLRVPDENPKDARPESET